MSRDDLVTLQTLEPGILVLLLQDEPGKNAFSEPFVEQLLACLDQIDADDEARVCLLRGLPEVFCAGAPRELLLRLADGELAPTDIVLSERLLDLPVPVVAAMEGHATGGGLALGLCADVALLARESSYGCSFMNLGFTPGMGTTSLLEEAVGPYLAREMMLGGQYFRGRHLEGRGNLNYVLPRDKVWGKAQAVARRMADKPRHALELLKRHLSARRRQRFQAAKTAEAQMHSVCFAHPETRQRIKDEYVSDDD